MMKFKWAIYLALIVSCRAVKFDDSQGVENDVEEGRNFHHYPRGFDPFVASINSRCENGEWAECFKSQALERIDAIFEDKTYTISRNVHVVQIPNVDSRSLANEPYEFSSEPRILDSEWEQFQKFLLRKLEVFLKSKAFEIEIPNDISEEGRYSPRFIDEISDEIDVIQDKKAPLLTKHRIKKLFIPMLIILKLFKLKLLLFLPFLLGLAGFKKLLGIAAFIIPGIIGYFKLCKPNTSPFASEHSYYDGYATQYSPQGIGSASYGYSNVQSPYSEYNRPSYNNPYSYYSRNINGNDAVPVVPSAPAANTVKFESNNTPRTRRK
jgi:hypothetical protein